MDALSAQFGPLDLVAIQEACVPQTHGTQYAVPKGRWQWLTNSERVWDTAIGMLSALDECMVRRGEGPHRLSATFRLGDREHLSIVNCHMPTAWGEGVQRHETLHADYKR